MTQKRILIVDSDAASRNFIARKLEELNYEILQASSGKEGLIFAWRDRPDLVIADPVLADLKGEEFAVRLRNDPRTAQLPIVALSSDHNPARIKSCQDAGINDYITKSGQAVPMLKDIINRQFGITAEGMRQGGLMLVFLSAKGGTGVSSICANAAAEIAKLDSKARIAVVDLVFPIGSIAQIVGYEGGDNVVTISNKDPLEVNTNFFKTVLTKMDRWNFDLLAGSPDPELSAQLNAERIWDMLLRLKAAYDYVLVDIGRALSKITLPLIQHADLLALLVSTDVSTISLTNTLLDFLKAKGVDSEHIFAILNRHAGLEGLSKKDAEAILGREINIAFPYLNTDFGFANSQHAPFTIKFPNNTATIIFKDSARQMTMLAKKIRES
ncbi:MAG: response regulator [Anaerolineales bacterium]|nr:response regulator [Anaerolineales bacterium]